MMEVDPSGVVKYTLRTKSLLKRIESERSRQGGGPKKREPKEKQKPPPLSKYRRRTANARERNRMREINEAFETLQKTLPDLPGVDAEKLTKITVLRLAVNYIKILSCVNEENTILDELKDIDELRDIWSNRNAEMAKPEHCVRPPFKPKSSNSQETPTNICSNTIKVSTSKTKPLKIKQVSAPKTQDTTTNKDKLSPPVKKRPSKSSKSRGKVCKTASVATSNGAYITLKNVAFQTPGSKSRSFHDNRPLMMSMTVKRPRVEPIVYQKPSKIARYECSLPSIKPNQRQPYFEDINQQNTLNLSSYSLPHRDIHESVLGTLLPLPYSSPTDQISEDKYLTSFTIYDLDSCPTKNDFFFKFPPKNNKRLAPPSLIALPSIDFTTPPSPLSLNTYSSSNLAESSPSSSSSNSSYTVSPYPSSYTSSDTEAAISHSVELDSLLGPDPFEEELDHLTSSLVETDDTLSLFLDHTASNFVCSDINGY